MPSGCDGQLNIVDVVKVLSEPETYQALLNSLFLATGVTITGTIVGTFFAWLVTRTDLPFKNGMKLLFLVPFMLPSFIGALAWKMLLSPRSGYINRLFMEGLGFEEPIFDIYSYTGHHPRRDHVSLPVRVHPGRRRARAHGPDAGGIGAHFRRRACSPSRAASPSRW